MTVEYKIFEGELVLTGFSDGFSVYNHGADRECAGLISQNDLAELGLRLIEIAHIEGATNISHIAHRLLKLAGPPQ